MACASVRGRFPEHIGSDGFLIGDGAIRSEGMRVVARRSAGQLFAIRSGSVSVPLLPQISLAMTRRL